MFIILVLFKKPKLSLNVFAIGIALYSQLIPSINFVCVQTADILCVQLECYRNC